MTILARVGVVIVTHNSSGTVVQTVQHLPVGDLAGVVVVDNASTDGTADAVEQLALPGVRVHRQANVGFGGGCNTGARLLTNAAALLFLNPDATIEAAPLAALAAYLDEVPSCAAVGPRLYSSGTPISSAGRLARTRDELRFVLPRRVALRIPDRRLAPDYDQTGPVGVIEGACMLFDAKAFHAAGGFDDRYFLFFEEHDLARRLARRGGEVHLLATARADHVVGVSRGALRLAGSAHYFASCVRYLRQYRGTARAAVFTAVALSWWSLSPRLGKMPADDAQLLRRSLVTAWRARGARR
ncbi:MAG: putative glycosyltransferase [Frankiales bacterium]|nr:putative glycosyltransferase [Frankiales bacterium]